MVDDAQQQESPKDGEHAGKKRDVSSAIAVDATTGTAPSEAASNGAVAGSLLNSPKRTKTEPRKWLAYSGVRHTRVGNDFQVANLPSPSSPSKETEEDAKEDTKDETSDKADETETPAAADNADNPDKE